mmetsp:Transcript_22999/g.49772  ORF Transcript_22999/g.49772 Transcript_22999/m.49772 type:complete len:326 (+) Transcript_22999:109-1086(+)|eukprot:CAMPEP_0172321306 /NCGR_PEP_ID=MMETSP1058-20130122/43027_1 /TAXON_ID=83371 /ORGANISM="Detonula confervacea, Strain CCMP 353" /LENGTH=325 /DNA_ID=CAMNT_0013036781 /DNA_START=58 /DNA_END=1032 /DNA_ORIENTATION=-
MIGMRQDSLVQQQCNKKRQFHPLSMPSVVQGDGHDNEHNEHQVPEPNANSATTSDDIGAETNGAGAFAEEDARSNNNVVKRNEGNVTSCASFMSDSQQAETKGVADRHQQQFRSNKNSNKIKFNNTGNWWRSLLRDMIMAFLPMLVLYKISTHPMVSNVGYQDPNAPKKYTPKEIFEQVLFRSAIKKQQEEFLFLEAMNEGKCYDFPTMGVPTQIKQQWNRPRTRRGSKGKNKPRMKITTARGKVYPGKMNRPMARRARASPPSSAPWTVGLASAIWGDHPTDAANVNKGAEATKRNSHVVNQKGGKKGSNRKARKKKFGRTRQL